MLTGQPESRRRMDLDRVAYQDLQSSFPHSPIRPFRQTTPKIISLRRMTLHHEIETRFRTLHIDGTLLEFDPEEETFFRAETGIQAGSYPAVGEQDRRNLMGVGGLCGGLGNLPFWAVSGWPGPFTDGWQQICVNKTDWGGRV